MALIPVGVLGASAGETFLTRRVLGRVSVFRQAAERMSGEDICGRLVEGNDEFADLAGTFNGVFGGWKRRSVGRRRLWTSSDASPADASHELKTPLTVIKGNTSIALSSDFLSPPEKAAFVEIDHAADSMVRLVQDLLYLARADAGALGTDRREILAIEVLQSAALAVGHVPGAPNQSFGICRAAHVLGQSTGARSAFHEPPE